METEDLLPYVLLSDLPQKYQPAAELVGFDAFIRVCQYYAGREVYFKKLEALTRKARNRMIIQEFNGNNTKPLAVKYNLTVLQVRNIVKSANKH